MILVSTTKIESLLQQVKPKTVAEALAFFKEQSIHHHQENAFKEMYPDNWWRGGGWIHKCLDNKLLWPLENGAIMRQDRYYEDNFNVGFKYSLSYITSDQGIYEIDFGKRSYRALTKIEESDEP